MIPEYALKLGLNVCFINVGVQKINSSIVKTFKIVLASFQIKNKLEKARFFQETFLFANFSIKMILEISFLILSNINMKFA